MSLYKIIKSLQSAQGSNAKLAILAANKDNELLKAYLKATYDPALSYYLKKAPEPDCCDVDDFDESLINLVIQALAGRLKTGNTAKEWLRHQLNCLGKSGQELLSLLISRSVGAGVGSTMVLKVFPKLFFEPGYMRCSLLDDKAKKLFGKLEEFLCQKKADGSFGYLVKSPDGNKGFTRAGTLMPQWFVDRLMSNTLDGDYVFVGEMLVYKDGSLLDRQTGNGQINSVLKGEYESSFSECDFAMEAWDFLPLKDFEAGLCKTPYEQRFQQLQQATINVIWVQPIESTVVKSLAEARSITSKYQLAGFEGSVYKTKDSPWKDHTSPYNVKDKVVFEAEYIVTAIYEGEGKAKGMLGGITIETSDGLLKCNCGSGFSDSLRKEMWKQPSTVIGSIVTIKANDVVASRSNDTKSLFLPIYSDTRFDRTEADNLERVLQQLAAVKGE